MKYRVLAIDGLHIALIIVIIYLFAALTNARRQQTPPHAGARVIPFTGSRNRAAA